MDNFLSNLLNDKGPPRQAEDYGTETHYPTTCYNATLIYEYKYKPKYPFGVDCESHF